MTGAAVLAAGVAAALILLTSSLYDRGLALAATTERVRLLMELESHALQHLQDGEEGELVAAVNTLARLRDTELQPEIERLETLLRSLAAAPTARERTSRLDAFVQALRRAVARQDEDSRRSLADAASWNRLARVTGLVAVIMLVTGVAAVLTWVWRSALQPLVALIEAIGRFASGDARARAPEEGPHEIKEVAVAFNEMAVALARQREQQLAFIGGVAHDLRSPLTTLHLAVSLLDQPSTNADRVRDRIRRQVRHLERMIGDLLDRTRIETGRLELHCEPCDLRDLVQRVVEVQREAASMRSFVLRLPDDPVMVRCDPLRIEQVVTNLITNAVKYSPESSDVEIVLKCDAGTAVIAVADRGLGMTEADRVRVFEPFRRGQNVANIAGIGLGLSVARKIVEAHSGTIGVESEPGAGSVFSVHLPLISM